MLGMAGDPETGSTSGEAPAAPLRTSFRTRAAVGKVYAATCGLEPNVAIDGAELPVVMRFEEFQCRSTSSMKLSSTPSIPAVVHFEPAEEGQHLVTIELQPPPGVAGDELVPTVEAIAKELQRRLALGHAGDACISAAECAPLSCTDGTCQEVHTQPAIVPRARVPRLGWAGESCRSGDDCEAGLVCEQGACATEHASRADRLLRTTRKVAVVGAWTLIPPICAIGVLILLQCLFMVIVAGCMYAGNG